MRIAVSCRSLEYPSGGVKEYLISLLRALLRIDTRNTYVLMHSSPEFLGLFPGARDVSLGCANRLIFDWLKLPAALKREHIDVAFFPSSNMPPGVPCKAVTAIMDLGYFHTGYRMYKWADTLYMRTAIRKTAHRSEHLLAISQYTQGEIIRLLGVAPSKVSVTPLAAGELYLRPTGDAAIREFKARHHLDTPYFLYTGNISPRKNLGALLEAFASVKDRIQADLALTGAVAWSDDFTRRVSALGLTNRVRRLGHVERDDMPALYAGALAFVFPSLFEGFGLPVLEAQASGTPVICSTAASLPEVAGDSAYMIDPKDVPGLARALAEVSADAVLRGDLIARGRGNVGRFSWEDTARKTLQAIENVAAAR